jgi:CDP-glucose 4,6-dehydratase
VEDVVSAAFWADKRVLVTGHTGFKGAWLTLWLARMGASVTGYGQTPHAEKSLFGLAGVGADCDTAIGDVRDFETVAAAMRDVRPDVVFHLAAQPLVRRSYREPLATWQINVMGTANVLEAVRGVDGVQALVSVTSDKCYENRGLERGYVETDPLGGHDPYSSSKAAAELVTDAYRRSFFDGPDGAQVASARAGNVIGGGDFGEDRLVSDLMRGALSGTPTPIRNPEAVRPWQHVLNALSGYLVLAEALTESADFGGAWNFGPDEQDERPVGQVADRLAQLWPERVSWTTDHDAVQPHEAAHLRLDSSKARARLGWRPRWDLDRALETIIDWHRALADGDDLRDLTTAQIAAFGSATVSAR